MKKLLTMLLAFFLIAMSITIGFAEQVPTSPPAIDLTPVFQAIIALFAALITAKVVPWIKSKTSVEQQLAMMATVKILVYAAEQLYGAGHGDEKLAWVKDTLQKKGYKLDTQLIKETIEAQVKELTVEQEKANL